MMSFEARGISKTLVTAAGKVYALRSFSAKFEARRRYAIVGPSGCGKSTLLYLLGLLDIPGSGDIFLNGRPTVNLSAEEKTVLRNRQIGFVFQFHFLLPELTVVENILLPALKAGVEMSAARERVDGLLHAIGLYEKGERFAGQLSGGEQQRVAVARALVNNPSVVLADEPTGNLDSANSEIIFELLSRVTVEQGSTLVVVTHNAELAEHCDEVIRLKDGERE